MLVFLYGLLIWLLRYGLVFLFWSNPYISHIKQPHSLRHMPAEGGRRWPGRPRLSQAGKLATTMMLACLVARGLLPCTRWNTKL